MENISHTAFVGIGSNIGDKLFNIRFALTEIEKEFSCLVEKISSVYETIPMGKIEQDFFFNAVIKIKTGLLPEALFLFLKSVEKKAGRVKRERWGPRELDLDILFYDDIIYNKDGLLIPHIGIAERDFVLIPLLEIEPDLVHPLLKLKLNDLREKLKTRNILKKISEDIKTITI